MQTIVYCSLFNIGAIILRPDKYNNCSGDRKCSPKNQIIVLFSFKIGEIYFRFISRGSPAAKRLGNTALVVYFSSNLLLHLTFWLLQCCSLMWQQESFELYVCVCVCVCLCCERVLDKKNCTQNMQGSSLKCQTVVSLDIVFVSTIYLLGDDHKTWLF